jgi:hypothetical protein
MAVTYLADLFNPEVLQRGIDKDMPKYFKFLPLAVVDNTLEGQAGNTITQPSFRYTGDAVEIGEGELIPLDNLQTSSKQVTVKKFGKAIPYTDEAMLSGYGDPVGQITMEHARAHANKMDNSIIEAYADAKLVYKMGAAGVISSDNVANALALFGEDEFDTLYLFVSPAELASLRVNEEWIKATDIGVGTLMSGVKGMIWGAQILVSNKLAGANYIIAPNAVRMLVKRGVSVEVERDARAGITTVISTQLYAPYLYDESKVIKLVKEAVDVTYTVSFDVAEGARPVASQVVVENGFASEPIPSALSDYDFVGWFTDNTYATEFDFESTAITANTTVYGKFVKAGYAAQADLDAAEVIIADHETRIDVLETP